MTNLSYVRAEPKRLRDLGFDEKWLQDRINEDPSILGLGDLVVITREHAQPSGGRIDFLMYDPEEEARYEIEVMLGRVDESHIIRTLEYWDIERKRFPSLQHRAVVVAEEITNRFFNIISLLNQAVPLIAIQLSAFELDAKIVLHFTTVLDLPEPESDEQGLGSEKVDRLYWEKRSNPASLRIVDRMLSLVPSAPGPARVTYNKYHIAVGTTAQNFLWLHPRKNASHLHMHVKLEGQPRTTMLQKLETAGIYSGPRGKEIKLRLSAKELSDHESLVRELVEDCERQSRE
jgi:hypothetical protein